MIANLSLTSKAVAFGDSTNNNNPVRNYFDWSRSYSGISVKNPKSQPETIDPGGSKTFFNGVRSTSLDNTTAWALSLNPLDPSRYRFTWTGGTSPSLRSDRALTLSGVVVTVQRNLNGSINLTLASGTFGSVVAGDVVFIPGVSTGDATTVFSEVNTGFWQVLAVVSSTNLQLVRPSGTAFTGTGEVVTLASNAQVQAFSATGVQVGDSVAISAGFVAATRKTFQLVSVTSKWFEVVSAVALAAETGITPTATGMVFYTAAKRFLRVESDQDVVVQYNGDTSETNRLTPDQPGDDERVAWLEKCFGPVWSLTVINKSASSASVVAMSAE